MEVKAFLKWADKHSAPHELLNGEKLPKPPGRSIAELKAYLGQMVKGREIVVLEGLMLSPNSAHLLQPDLVVIHETIWKAIPLSKRQMPLTWLKPDLVVVTAKQLSAEEVSRRLAVYALTECQQVWVVEESRLSLYALSDGKYTPIEGDTWNGAGDLSAFTASVADIRKAGQVAEGKAPPPAPKPKKSKAPPKPPSAAPKQVSQRVDSPVLSSRARVVQETGPSLALLGFLGLIWVGVVLAGLWYLPL